VPVRKPLVFQGISVRRRPELGYNRFPGASRQRFVGNQAARGPGGRADGRCPGAGGAVSVATGPNPDLAETVRDPGHGATRRWTIKGLARPGRATFPMLETGRDMPRQAARGLHANRA
jgi:hypothetical protein